MGGGPGGGVFFPYQIGKNVINNIEIIKNSTKFKLQFYKAPTQGIGNNKFYMCFVKVVRDV
jgi:hypothetical protein